MTEILSLWRSPLDRVAMAQAVALSDRQPKATTIEFDTDFSAITVYNFGTYGAVPGGAAATNTSALGSMFSAMSELPVGGTALIEQDNFPVNATLDGILVTDQSNVIGTGGGGTATGAAPPFFHFTITPQGSGNRVFFNCIDGPSDGHTSGGIYFRSLAFQWGSTSDAKDTCIYADVWNTRAINCTFTDCPRAFNAQALSCTLEQCTINYTVSSPGSTTAVILANPQCGVLGPGQFSQTSQAPGSGGAAGCVCISIQNAEHPVVTAMQLYEWTIGIDFSGQDGTRFAQITNCEIECWATAINIQLSSSLSATTAGIKVTSCALYKASDSNDSSPIVLIDARGSGNNDMLNDIALTDCTVYSIYDSPPANQHGLEITSGSSIRIIGGTYSNNSPTGGAGIAITGSVADLQIVGANLQPSYVGAAPTINLQQYGLYVTASVTNVLVDGCDLSGYSSALGQTAVEVTAAQSANGLRITNCPGYNDVNTPLSATSTMLRDGVSAATCSTPYFGPSVITYSSTSGVPVTLYVFGQSITSTFGIVFLPSAYDTFHFSAVPSIFSWVGK